MNVLVKYLLTAGVVVVVSEAAKRSDRLGGLIGALPIMTVLTLVWLHVEGQSAEKISNHAWYTFWYVLPSLPMFVLFPWAMARVGFWGAMGMSVGVTGISFLLLARLVARFGIQLW
ncbi:MAG TPA: DUF3147 family protein [Fibrobacteria bacterium]|nr:DUF3147 family protein [Fibrobacteria bacterium]HOX53445.1 DUF3147 family protein [Fibrobacteria bacterium]